MPVVQADINASLAGEEQVLRDLEALMGRAATVGEKKKIGIQVGLDAKKTSADLAALNSQLGASPNILKKFSDSMKNANTKLKKFGLDTQDLAIIMGAGLAGGVAFAIREVIQFGVEIVTAAGHVEELRNQAAVTFGGATDDIRDFAENAATNLGISEAAALEAASSFGALAKGIGISAEDSEVFAERLVTLAANLASFKDIPFEQALTAIRSGLIGETEPLRRLGIQLDAATTKREAYRRGIADEGKELDNTQKFLTNYQLILEKAADSHGDFARTQEGLPNQVKTFQAQIEDLKVALGEVLVPAIAAAIGALNDLLGPIVTLTRKVDELFKSIEENAKNTGDRIRELLGGPSNEELFAELRKKSDEELKELVDRAERLGLSTATSETARAILAEREAKKQLTGANKDLELSSSQAAIAESKLRAEQEKTKDMTNQLEDAELRLARARLDGRLRIADAERNLTRAQEDAANRLADAEKTLNRAIRDRQRALDDANEKVADARRDGFRSIRDAREQLEDAQRENIRSTRDEERELKEATRDRINTLVDGQISIERAMREGNAEAENAARLALAQAQQDTDIAEQKKQIDEERKDRLREIERLERDLAETRIDVADNIADAQRDLQRTIEDSNERVEDAQENLRRTYVENSRSIEDAQRAVGNAIRDSARSIRDAKTHLERLREESGNLAENLKVAADEAERLAEGFQGGGGGGGFSGHGASGTFQHGGLIRGGQLGLVGEAGPELFRPSSSGTIFPADFTRWLFELLQGGPVRGGGSLASPTFYIQVPTDDPETLARRIASRLVQSVG